MIAPGTLFAARYRVDEKIGDGGMQSVYRGTDTLVGRPIALKTPLPGQGHKRFKDSATISGRINHHFVAKTYDYFEEGGSPFLIEEYIAGPNLEQAVPEGAVIDPHDGARLMLGLAKGVSASHAAGVVHRDLKPSNLIGVGSYPFREVKITDFGIATLTSEVFADAAKSGDLTRSTSGTVRGALPYMAPEMMFRKAGEHPGSPGDIWSIGALMFRLLAGEVPFGHGFEVPVNIRNGSRKPWPPFMTSKPQFAPLSRELQSIIEGCLIADANTRPSASDLVSRCETLCFSSAPRETGKIFSLTGSIGRIRTDSGRFVFFHSDSVFVKGPRLAVGERVNFSAFPGIPNPRAHPVCRIPA